MKASLQLLPLALSLAGSVSALAATRFDEFTAKFKTPPNPVKVISAGFLGGAGTEWLVGGGFQPDGTVVAAGVTLGPKLELGVRETVLGKDAAITAPVPIPKVDKKGNPEMDKEGKPKLEALGWKHPNATAFVARLSGDLKTIKSVTRFGWLGGGLTGAVVDAAGNIYLCGPATGATAGLSADSQEMPVAAPDATDRGTQHTYLARLSPDAAKVVWVRHFKGSSAAPTVALDPAGRVLFKGPDYRVFDAAGKLVSAQAIPGGAGGFVAVNPVDGTWARGAEHHSPTGREPYRCPMLNIHRPNGELLYQLYDWAGPFIGLNNLRLESDTAIRGVVYDAQGNLLLHAWSDGGNSVALREPMDIRTSAKMGGLGFSAWGAGVLSCAYVIKIDPKTCKVIGGTPWLSYQQTVNKPNSARIHTLASAVDGSVCFAGGSSMGLIQTGNAIGSVPGGEFVAVLNEDCSSLRFCSAMPACADVFLDDSSPDKARWGIVSGKVNGKPVALFLGSAVEFSRSYDQNPAPAVNARQAKFGGGLADGYLLMLDLAK